MKRFLLLSTIALFFMSCDKVATKLVTKVSKETVSEISEGTAEQIGKQVARKGAKGVASEAAEKGAARALRELIESNIIYRTLYEKFQKNISQDFADDIIVQSSKDVIEMSSKKFPNSAIKISGNTLIGKGGSLIDNGPVNEFLNHVLPNKTYIVDDLFVYQTDHLGRVTSCSSNRTKAFQKLGGKRNPQRNSDVQKMVIDHLDGRKGLDDGGHLFSRNSGGPNELINQVPMDGKLNKGAYKKLEEIEEKALREGKNVQSKRNLLYKGDSKRPYAIEFITTIDGVETKTILQNI